MSGNWKLVITVVNVVAVPLAAFLIRMYRGETRSSHEEEISLFVRAFVQRYFPAGGTP